MSTHRFGKFPPKLDYRTLRFKNYVMPTLAPPPSAYDVLARVYAALKISDSTVLFPMDGNDTLGGMEYVGEVLLRTEPGNRDHRAVVAWPLIGKARQIDAVPQRPHARC